MWDDEVDVVCVGAGIGGLASAIAAVEDGADVFVAASTTHGAALVPATAGNGCANPIGGWLSADVADCETHEYFESLAADLPPLIRFTEDIAAPFRVVEEFPPPSSRRDPIEPFFGAKLRDWAAQCLTSPYGLLYTRLCGEMTTKMRGTGGELIEVMDIGSLDLTVSGGAAGIADWLLERAHDLGIRLHEASPLQRIVFEEGEVVGVVIGTPDGPRSVRARHGVTVAPEVPQAALTGLSEATGEYDRVRVCIVGRAASRFGRVELLATEPAAKTAACEAMSRGLHDSPRDSRRRNLQARRCRKLDGYPPLGQ
jgi:hypothetical protein